MKGVIRNSAGLVLLVPVLLMGNYGSNVGYEITVPAQSRLGLFQTDKSITTLGSDCLATDLSGSTVNNNNGTAGVLKGTVSALQICPCMQNGVSYWNPLAVVNAHNPCTITSSTFSPVANKNLSGTCQGSEALFGAVGANESSANASMTSDQTKMMTDLASKFAYVSADKEYQDRHDLVQEQALFLINAAQDLKPDPANGKDYLSVPYLKFCTAFSQSFVTSNSLNDASKELFGVDTSTYFPSNQFVFALDLQNDTPVNVQQNDVIRERHKGSDKWGGVLMRAVEQGYIDLSLAGGSDSGFFFAAPTTGGQSAKTFLKQVKPITPDRAQALIAKYANASGSLSSYPNIAGERAMLEELVMLHLAMMQPLTFGAGMNNPSYATISNPPSGQKIDNTGTDATIDIQQFQVYNNVINPEPLSRVYSQLFYSASYLRGLLVGAGGNRATYAPQPVDTFYGVVIINNGTFHGAKTQVIQGLFGAPCLTGQVMMIKASGGIDSWQAAGTNPESLEKYRSISLSFLYDASGSGSSGAASYAPAMQGTVEIHIEAGKSDITSNTSEAAIRAPGIAITHTANEVRSTVQATPLIQNFFNESPLSPWAVVIEIINKTDSNGITSPEPTFQVVGLARLDPNDFASTCQAGDLSGITLQPFTVDMVFNARNIIANQIKAMPGMSIKQGNISVPETNMNLVKFNGALSYGWGGSVPISKALKTMETLMTQSSAEYLGIDNTDTKVQTHPSKESNNFFPFAPQTFVQKIQKADQSQDAKGAIIPVGTKTYATTGISSAVS